MKKPRGCAAKPFQKKQIAVFGSGGYMGATIFGFLQRAASIYGTGIGGTSISTPRSICATPSASTSLNRVLGNSFKLAYAGEDMVRLTDMSNVESIAQRLSGGRRGVGGIDAAILGTIYQLEERSVALNTYEKSPNDKTFEFYLDEQKFGGEWDDEANQNNDIDFHLQIFQNSVNACKDAGLEHVVVIETPITKDSKPFINILNDVGVPFTYIIINGKLENTKLYTFEEGIQCDLEVEKIGLSDIRNLNNNDGNGNEKSAMIAREDVAALAVQSLMSLEWTKNTCLNVSCKGYLEQENDKRNLKSDNVWCMKSERIAGILNDIIS